MEAEVTGRWLPPTGFWFGFHIERDFTMGFTSTLELILNTRPASFSVPTHGYLWISVQLLNRQTDGSNDSCGAVPALLMWNIQHSEGFVALHQHWNGLLRSYKLTFVMHNGVTKSKRDIWVLVHRVLLKLPHILSPGMGFFSCYLILSCFTRVFWPETFVECSMTNVLGRKTGGRWNSLLAEN